MSPIHSSRGSGSPQDWTILLYVASVDDCQTPIDLEVIERLKAHAPYDVNVVYQLVTVAETVRGVIRAGGRAEVWARSPSVNVTRAKHLTSFVDWAQEICPSRYTALLLKGHGEAWMTPQPIVGPPCSEASIGPAPRLRNTAIFYDGANGQWMRTTAIRKAIERTRRRRVDVYGFDACFMSAVEVAYEIRSVASFMVASEPEEVSSGWPYPEIVGQVTGRTSPGELAEMIVATPSAFQLASIELEWVGGLAKALDALGGYLSLHAPVVAKWILSNGATNLFGSPNIDLATLLELLTDADLGLGSDLRPLIGTVRGALEKATRGCVSVFFPWCPVQTAGAPAPFAPRRATSLYWGFGGRKSPGVPIPKPCPSGSPFMATYGAVAFGRRNRWADFLSNLNAAWVGRLHASATTANIESRATVAES